MRSRSLSLLLGAIVCAAARAYSQAPQTNLRELVQEASRKEVFAAADNSNLLTYKMRKESTSGTALRQMLETKEGILARTIQWDGRNLTKEEQAKEVARLQRLVNDPGERRKKFREQQVDED